jgi:hypothetical protein
MQAPGCYAAAGIKLVWTVADATDKNEFVMSGNELLLAQNGHATDAKTVTLSSSANARGRTKDIAAESILAGDTHIFGPFTNKDGWVQTGGVLHCEAESDDISFACVKLS